MRHPWSIHISPSWSSIFMRSSEKSTVSTDSLCMFSMAACECAQLLVFMHALIDAYFLQKIQMLHENMPDSRMLRIYTKEHWWQGWRDGVHNPCFPSALGRELRPGESDISFSPFLKDIMSRLVSPPFSFFHPLPNWSHNSEKAKCNPFPAGILIF